MTALPYKAQILPNKTNLVAIPVKDYVVLVPKKDFFDFVAVRDSVKNAVGVHPNNNQYVLVRKDVNSDKAYVAFFRALVLPQEFPVDKITQHVFNVFNDFVPLHEVRGGRLSTKKTLLNTKANLAVTALSKMNIT